MSMPQVTPDWLKPDRADRPAATSVPSNGNIHYRAEYIWNGQHWVTPAGAAQPRIYEPPHSKCGCGHCAVWRTTRWGLAYMRGET